MSMTTPIVDFVRSYAKSGTSRLHMPGHKGQKLLGFEEADITEIKGADELYEAEGIIAESEANATKLFGTAHTYYSTEGSSQCIRAMLCLALQAAPAGQRPVLLAARNAHKALLYAAALLDFDIEWLWPAPEAAGALCSCPVTAGQLEQALERLSGQGRTPFGVYVTSPDYLGGMQDIAALSKVCDAHGVPLLVDNAHGAYLNFLVGGSKHPMALGAAMCCDSGHKTLPVLTGGAYLHLGLKAPVQDETAVRNALALFGSTSPSYLILQSLDRCNRYLSEGYPLRLYSCCGQLTRLRRVLNEAAAAAGSKLSLAVDDPAREPLKLTLDAAALGLTGTALAEALRKYAIECEYADPGWKKPLQRSARHCPVYRNALSRKGIPSPHWRQKRNRSALCAWQSSPRSRPFPPPRRWAGSARCPPSPARPRSPSWSAGSGSARLRSSFLHATTLKRWPSSENKMQGQKL